MNNVNYIKGKTVSFHDLWNHFGLVRDKGYRWVDSEKSPAYVSQYLCDIRPPSRAWPNSYAKALLTQKFAKVVCKADPELALKLGIAEVVE